MRMYQGLIREPPRVSLFGFLASRHPRPAQHLSTRLCLDHDALPPNDAIDAGWIPSILSGRQLMAFDLTTAAVIAVVILVVIGVLITELRSD